jgi:hypothetical protein
VSFDRLHRLATRQKRGALRDLVAGAAIVLVTGLLAAGVFQAAAATLTAMPAPTPTHTHAPFAPDGALCAPVSVSALC